ncbi:coilin [Salvia miltiorrhiza]|uniref:coilin n=1 Tax=Salvia miltiorrhiza TaxID=226208 RepID=UPI0025ABDBB3|nr:coilin [Salvia miltiorrhiza]
MDLGKRIRVVFKDDDILSETQKLEGFSRSWVLLEPPRHDAVSDLASHLLHAFQLHQSCPHGLLLSISGFVLPPFVSTSILKDNEIISVRKRKDILSIEGNKAANDVQKLKALEKRPVDGGVLLLANEEFEKEKGGYESDEEFEDDDEVPLEVVENSSGRNSNKKNRKRKVAESKDDDEVLLDVNEDSSGGHSRKKNRKRKAAEMLEGNKDKKHRSVVTGNGSSDVCKEKKDVAVAGNNVKNKDEPAKHSDKKDVEEPGEKRTVDVQEKDNETGDAKIAPKETKKARSRSARRKTEKRRWLREMAKIQKQNATCESEGLRNWKEDQAKADRKKPDGQLKGQQKWKKYQADDERNKADGQPKGLLHWKLSSQNNGLVKGKKHKRHNQNDDFLELLNQNGDVRKQQTQNGDVHKQQNQNDDIHEQLTQMGDRLEQPSLSLHEEPGQSSPSVQEHTNQNCDASKRLNHKSAEDNEVVPIEIRPGHIRFEPLEEEEAVQQDHAPLETFNWNGITSKKKGQQWGKENRRFTPRNDYRTNKEDCETLTKEKEKQPKERINFDKLPLLSGSPKKGDLIAYRILELSSTWTPELSAHRVGKVSWYNVESNQTMLLPVPEYPIVSEEDDEDEAAQLDNSLYKEDGSLEVDFSSLIDVRVLTNGGSKPDNKTVACVNEASTSNVNALKTALPGSSGEPTAEPSPDTQESDQGKEMQLPSGEIGGSVWDQLSEALNAKKDQLSKENGWGSTPKKVVVSHENSWGKNAKKVQPSPGSNWEKNSQKPQPSQGNSWCKQNAGSKSWSYKALRGSALGPTMAMLRSKRDS